MQLYDKHGGFAAISQRGHAFSDKVLASPCFAPSFAAVEMAALIDHPTTFLCKVLGGLDSDAGRAIRDVHQPHRITPAVAGRLEEAQVEPADAATPLRVVASVQGDVVAG